MGCIQSSSSSGGGPGANPSEKSRQIERELAIEQQIRRSTITIFLAGAGESGKSTVLKQLRVKYSESPDPYDRSERAEFISIILSNTIQSMVVLLTAALEMDAKLSTQAKFWANSILDAMPSTSVMVDSFTPSMVEAISGLWREESIQDVYGKSSQYQLNDSAAYFFDNLSRTAAPDFVPTNDDILRARVRTTGIIETRFQVGPRLYKVIDVGGQRSERRKWISAFEGVDCLLFLFSTSEFDQVLREDKTTNRLVESESLFESISNSNWFRDSTIVLFLNKIDLFAAKICHTPLASQLPEYTGPNTLEASLTYMRDRLVGMQRSGKPIYSHFTTATDTKAIDVVLSAVNEQILTAELRKARVL